jgi:hypothetical protein
VGDAAALRDSAERQRRRRKGWWPWRGEIEVKVEKQITIKAQVDPSDYEASTNVTRATTTR